MGGACHEVASLPRKLVGVVPVASAHRRRHLFATLEEAFPVRFEGCEANALGALDGVLEIVEPDASPVELVAVSEVRCPRLRVFEQTAASLRAGVDIDFTSSSGLPLPLRNRQLGEECGPARQGPPSPEAGIEVLAVAEGRPVWWRSNDGSGWAHFSAFSPAELGVDEALRDHLRLGRFMGLLPLLALLERVCGDRAWEKRPLKAAFVVDDPNLHGSSYGYLRYPELIAHSVRHGYHVALATVPLDGWFSRGRARELIRGNPQSLSLLVHGNDHVAGELLRLADARIAERVLAQALRRILALERRAGVCVDRVMVPPHELCSTVALAAMFRLGFEAACIGRRHPWRDTDAISTMVSARLIKWYPTDIVDGGLPIVPRHPIEQARQELVFRALLGQPLILFAHHGDFADGLDALEQAASEINGLGDVRWESVGSIARDCFFTRRVGSELHVQMHARRIALDVPEGVGELQVELPSLLASEPVRRLSVGSARVALTRMGGSWRSGSLPVTPGKRVELTLLAEHPLQPATVPAPRPTLWPVARRALVEGRDRLRPLLPRH